jgi:hypothetical protein
MITPKQIQDLYIQSSRVDDREFMRVCLRALEGDRDSLMACAAAATAGHRQTADRAVRRRAS